MSDYQIIDTNADNIGGCSHCGNKNANNLGHRRKTNWLRGRYAEGLRYKVLRSEKSGDVGMIEYALGNHAWRPLEAEGYLVIHCLWVYGKHKDKGLGSLLLHSCLEDAENSQCRGVAVVTSSDSLMAGSDLFLKAGFVSVDRTIGASDASAAPYDLLVKKFKKTARKQLSNAWNPTSNPPPPEQERLSGAATDQSRKGQRTHGTDCTNRAYSTTHPRSHPPRLGATLWTWTIDRTRRRPTRTRPSSATRH